MPDSDKPTCGLWMPVSRTYCGRKPRHRGKCVAPEALRQQVANRPRKTARRVGTRLSDDPEVRARWRRNSKFSRLGISEARYMAVLEAQGYACGICREPFGDTFPQADHDHACHEARPGAQSRACEKCFRGLLCVPCNTGLGWMETYADLADAYRARVSTRSPHGH